jgi:O-antigen/teichoic acid export membrane protein
MNRTEKPQSAIWRLSDLLDKLKKSTFFKNVFVVMSGTAIAQVVTFALTPIISRLFSPSDFGIFGSFTAVAGIIAAGVTLEYSTAVFLPKERELAFNLLALSLLSTAVVSFLCLMLALVFPASLNGLMNTKGFWPLALLVLAILASGGHVSFGSWAVRSKAFKDTAASDVIRSFSGSGLKIGFGYLKIGGIGLIISYIMANLFASFNLFRVLRPDLKVLRGQVQWGLMKRLAKEYRDFPLYSASQNVINAISTGLPVLLLTRFYGISIAGAYAFGVSAIQVPMGFVLTALRQVLFQRACEIQHQGGRLTALYIKTTAGLFAMVLLPSLVLLLWAPQLFSWVFGAKWHFAGELTRVLIFWYAIVFCNLPAVLFARIIRIQSFVFVYNLVLLFARTLVLIMGGLYLSAIQTVLAFSVVGALMNAFLIFHVGRSMIKKEASISNENVRALKIE